MNRLLLLRFERLPASFLRICRGIRRSGQKLAFFVKTATHLRLKALYITLFFVLTRSVLTIAQPLGGQRVFSFLDLPMHARVAALGGQVATAIGPDGAYHLNNPALADSVSPNLASISLMPYLAAAKYYTIQYGLPIRSSDPDRHAGWAIGMQYLSYGQLDRKSTRLNSSHSDRSRMPSSA